ncbi:MAG: cation diffusion facilitator family transporter [Lachnospiraceae bacterium]|nr:cation diffusion facilitator family transporter [Lachnospiraceae bacterium]
MIQFFSKIWIKDCNNYKDAKVRQAYGILCGLVGIGFNLLLFAGKFFAGIISHSIAITADAFNNLSDAASSVITLIGFKLAGKRPDPNHPYGMGRMEYLSGLLVAAAILLMAVELIKTSIDKIIHPNSLEFSPLIVVILLASITVKCYMAFYNGQIGKKINSPAMEATSKDSFGDMLSTTVVLLATIISHYTGLLIDGYCGLLVGVFILYSGIQAFKDTLDPLLGQPPSEEFVDKIEEIVMSHKEILGMHDLLVHDYGPGRVIISLHAEVSYLSDILESHDLIDRIEFELRDQLLCDAVIHMDPLVTDDKDLDLWKNRISSILKEMNPEFHMHDFRMVRGNTHTNLIFDVVVPFHYTDKDTLTEKIREAVLAIDASHFCVIHIENDYAGR